jgi:thiamine biosynthesis protein ThiS
VPPTSENFTESKTIEIVLNGEPKRVRAGLTVWELLVDLEVDPERVAVELNRVIVRQPDWRERKVEAGATVEIVQFVGGG